MKHTVFGSEHQVELAVVGMGLHSVAVVHMFLVGYFILQTGNPQNQL